MRDLPTGNLRTMSWATLANTVGWGLWGAAEALYLTRIVGLTPLQVGAGMTIAGLIGLSASVPLGRLADRRDPRAIRSFIQIGQGSVAIGYLFLHSFWPFLLLATLEALLMTSNITVRAALVSAVGGPAGRVHAFAVLRVVARIGQSSGAGFAAFALAVDSRLGYQLLILGNSFTYFLSAALLMRLPAFPPATIEAQSRGWRALRDLPFLSVTASSAIVSIHRPVIGLLVPLWIAQHTAAPITAVSAVLIVNTIVGILATIPASRGLTTALAAGNALRRAGILLSIAMILYAAAAFGSRPFAITMLLVATVAYSVGDLLHATADTSLAYDLAVPTAIGEYQGASQLVSGAAFAIGPIILSGLVLDQPAGLGWVGLAAVFTGTGLVIPRMVRWAVGKRLAPA